MKTKIGITPVGVAMLILIGILVIGGVAYYVGKVPTPVPQSIEKNNYQAQSNKDNTNNTIDDVSSFEQAINANNLAEVKNYLPDSIYVVLEGSSCCGQTNVSQAIQELGKLSGRSFSFDKNSELVLNYLSSQLKQYPTGRKLGPNLLLNDLKIGVEITPNKNKAIIGYRLVNGKVTDLFIDPGVYQAID